jgi:hypothetical protein
MTPLPFYISPTFSSLKALDEIFPALPNYRGGTDGSANLESATYNQCGGSYSTLIRKSCLDRRVNFARAEFS